MDFYETLPAPGLALVFNPDGRPPFLRKAYFKKAVGMRANGTLAETPPGPRVLCAFCIFILLTKYKGADPVNPEKPIIHKDEEKQLSWLNTLAIDKGRLEALIHDCFDGYHFFTFSRGIAKKVPAWAELNPRELKLENVRLYKTGPDSSPVLLQPAEWPKLAEKLEAFGTGQRHRAWEPTVKKQVEEIQNCGWAKVSARSKRTDIVSEASMEGCRIAPQWRELFSEAFDEIGRQELAGEWYIVCGTIHLMQHWSRDFSRAVERGATVRLAHQASNAPDGCSSVAAQWKMNIEHFGKSDPIRFLKNRMIDSISQLATWDREACQKRYKGKFEFYESYIYHPFFGALVVPQPVKKGTAEPHPAPKGTQCFLAMTTFYPKSTENRVELHFYKPSASLDIYYNSIRNFFSQGKKPSEGYLKRVDHAAKRRRAKT